MNNIDIQYQNLLKDILENGAEKKDRTGTGTLSVFGKQIRHKMSEGFPLLTTKKMYFKGIVTELLWFLRGDTSVKFLLDNDCNIWNGDLYKSYEKIFDESPKIYGANFYKLNKEEFIKRLKIDKMFLEQYGNFGPIYGKQWRSWSTYPSDYLTNPIDQIQTLIYDLKSNPDSRRLMVSAWNVGELDQMVLPPCHYGFQVYTSKLSSQERKNLYDKSNIVKDTFPTDENGWNDLFDDFEIPERKISLLWNQRSVDTFLGLPFNIASYATLLEILGKTLNMVPDELIGNLGDTHLYLNHLDQAKEQISRNFYELPTLEINNEEWSDYNSTRDNDINDFISNIKVEDFKINNYVSHPKIEAKLSN